MERNARPSLSDAVDLAANMPWQLGSVLTLIAYWVSRDLSAWGPMGNGDGIGLGDSCSNACSFQFEPLFPVDRGCR